MSDEKTPIKPTSLILNNLELNPYQYVEDRDYDNALTIRFRVKLSRDQYSDLGKLPPVVKVTRCGIDDEPMEMELLEVAWSSINGEIKEEIWLSDKEYPRSVPSLGWVGELAVAVAEQGLILDELLSTLVSNGILADVKIKEMKEKITKERNWLKRREFNRLMEDLDEFKRLDGD